MKSDQEEEADEDENEKGKEKDLDADSVLEVLPILIFGVRNFTRQELPQNDT